MKFTLYYNIFFVICKALYRYFSHFPGQTQQNFFTEFVKNYVQMQKYML